MAEVWKPVVGYEGLYEVSDQARVRSQRRMLRINIYPCGTRVVCLHRNRTQRSFAVAKLMFEAFIQPVPEGLVVSYVNKNRADLRLDNLLLCTRSDINRRYGLGRPLNIRKHRRVIFLYENGYMKTEIAQSVGVSYSLVQRILKPIDAASK